MINSLELGKKVIKEKIPLIPKNPGIYKMISSTGEILYGEVPPYSVVVPGTLPNENPKKPSLDDMVLMYEHSAQGKLF